MIGIELTAAAVSSAEYAGIYSCPPAKRTATTGRTIRLIPRDRVAGLRRQYRQKRREARHTPWQVRIELIGVMAAYSAGTVLADGTLVRRPS